MHHVEIIYELRFLDEEKNRNCDTLIKRWWGRMSNDQYWIGCTKLFRKK